MGLGGVGGRWWKIFFVFKIKGVEEGWGIFWELILVNAVGWIGKG